MQCKTDQKQVLKTFYYSVHILTSFNLMNLKDKKGSPERDTKTLLEISALLKMHKPNVTLTLKVYG